MDFDLLFLAASKDQSTKGLIIRCLAAHNELTNVQLQSMIRKEFGKRISYQAIRQALMELLDEHVLAKNAKIYSIKPQWVLDLKDIVDTLDKSLKRQNIQIVDKTTTQIQLKNLYELGHFILFGLDYKYFDLKKKGGLLLQLNHLWIPFSDMHRRERLTSIFKENNPKVVVKSKSPADKILKKWYSTFGPVKLGARFQSVCEYIVHGDSVVEIFMDPGLKKKMDQVYGLKGIVSLDLFNQLSDMTYKEYGIQLVITRNAKIADQVRNQIEKQF
ncbi:MAG: hypothetical protein KKG59_07880 [Nanoarchaeota archaeon]|nr:hypothetical protein [Nanoarchaeota archaeon]